MCMAGNRARAMLPEQRCPSARSAPPTPHSRPPLLAPLLPLPLQISVTSGVVSRIEVTAYAHGATELLGVQIDAAINSGNSGG